VSRRTDESRSTAVPDYNEWFASVAKRQFGVSTHLYHNQRLSREHLLEIAAYGFEVVEVFATPTHFDYHNPAVVADLQQWLAEAGLQLGSVHAPVSDSYTSGRLGRPLSIASPDENERAAAVAEAQLALQHVARRIPIRTMVAHLGVPRTQQPPGGANARGAARRSIEELQRIGEPLGVAIAVEVLPNELSSPGSLVHFVENDLEPTNVGICLDFGHAHLDGDVVEAIETVSEHLIATHVHDNRGRNDDHLVPFEGTIDWLAALTAVQKVGYDGTLLFEIAAHGSAKETLARAQKTRERMERLLVHG
jgi:sugar phosphate isomerase/epimerase